MKRFSILPIVPLLLIACADDSRPTAPDLMQRALVASSDYTETWFTTTPPDPAYVGDSYEVRVVAMISSPNLYSTPEVCPLSDITREEGNTTTAIATFIGAGTCILEGEDPAGPYMINEPQVFEVVERRGSENAPVAPGTPPRGRPR
jgi:hypothetical protein